ncbi:MAG: hypothetical protein R3F29_15195 [Planctomycetota bacterium]
MLANPIVIPAEANPFLWLGAILATIAEIAVVRRVLARGGLDTTRVVAWLWLIQLWSWFSFLMVVDRLGHDGTRNREALVITIAELVVIALEAPLFWLAAKAGQHRDDSARRGVSFGRALLASALGNATSIGVSLALAGAIGLLLRSSHSR